MNSLTQKALFQLKRIFVSSNYSQVVNIISNLGASLYKLIAGNKLKKTNDRQKIYFIWDSSFKKFRPTGQLPGEKMKKTPKQGYGIFQITTWLDIEIDYSKIKVNNWINDLKSEESDLGGMYANAILLFTIDDYIFLYNEYNRRGEVLLSRKQF